MPQVLGKGMSFHVQSGKKISNRDIFFCLRDKAVNLFQVLIFFNPTCNI